MKHSVSVKFRHVVSKEVKDLGVKRTTKTTFKTWKEEIELPLEGSVERKIACPICKELFGHKESFGITVYSYEKARKGVGQIGVVAIFLGVGLFISGRYISPFGYVLGGVSVICGIIRLIYYFSNRLSPSDFVHCDSQERHSLWV